MACLLVYKLCNWSIFHLLSDRHWSCWNQKKHLFNTYSKRIKIHISWVRLEWTTSQKSRWSTSRFDEHTSLVFYWLPQITLFTASRGAFFNQSPSEIHPYCLVCSESMFTPWLGDKANWNAAGILAGNNLHSSSSSHLQNSLAFPAEI